ncbi:O-fucosyltransferase 20-like [Zingiber officinale]|uniref:O-fucosyltransferase 20-like n=1 Tax=Zingiber officinale TaxID=94328 RepID=UPI001C4C3FED|nr:O-fucosyltransferase 20-like [Zingiber officinale]
MVVKGPTYVVVESPDHRAVLVEHKLRVGVRPTWQKGTRKVGCTAQDRRTQPYKSGLTRYRIRHAEQGRTIQDRQTQAYRSGLTGYRIRHAEQGRTIQDRQTQAYRLELTGYRIRHAKQGRTIHDRRTKDRECRSVPIGQGLGLHGKKELGRRTPPRHPNHRLPSSPRDNPHRKYSGSDASQRPSLTPTTAQPASIRLSFRTGSIHILETALVVPILQVNAIWGDESEFNDIFDLEHFKKVLSDDVKVVSPLPSTHIRMRPGVENQLPLHASPQLIEKRYLKRLNRDGVLLLRGLDSRLSKDLPPDLQKLRCIVEFHALRFAAPIQEFGDKLASRMRSKGPYLALHLRLEKDVWVRTGCFPGLSPEYDETIRRERKLRPKVLTGRSNMTFHERKLAGFCPLNALEITRLLKALGTPRDAMIYWAGGRPLGGAEALRPLTTAFPNVYNKESISSPGELRPFASRASVLAAVDYIVCEQSDVFMPSHGGNMGHLMQGHRAFAGHRKFITPNKRQMLPLFLDASLPEREFERIVKELHWGSTGQPEWRTGKASKDVTAYPIHECMCKGTSAEVRR